MLLSCSQIQLNRRQGRRNFVPGLASALLLLTILPAAPAGAAPITFSTALPVAKGEGIFRLQAQYLKADSDPSPLDRDLEVLAVPVVGVYGWTEKLALFAILPYLDLSLAEDTPSGRRTRSGSGLGDATLLARYTAFHLDRPGMTFRIAPFAGLEVPTGQDDETDRFGRLPQPLQPGSGSWDPLFGTVITWQTLAWQVDGALSYQANTEANDFEAGDVTRLDLSYQYRLWPRALGPGVPAFFYGVLEGNLIRQGRNEIGGRKDPDSGGTVFNLVPGLQYVTRRTVWEAAVQIPIIQDLHGNGLERDYTAILSFRINF